MKRKKLERNLRTFNYILIMIIAITSVFTGRIIEALICLILMRLIDIQESIEK